MALLISILCCLLLIPIFILVGVFCIEVGIALPKMKQTSPPSGRRPRIAILMPAHNEEGGITATIANLMPQLIDGDRLLVVADNCDDRTAELARLAGAEVCERSDALRRGKGYALDFGIAQLAANPPEVVIVIDADCLVTPGALDRLGRTAAQCQQPIQALYLMYAPAGAATTKKVAEFAFLVKNFVRPLGLYRLNLPAQLTGTGMAFPWSVMTSVSLASGHIVEDMKLGVDLAKAGTPARFCPEALVYSTFPSSVEGTASQRTRWEHGHVSVILKEGPRLLLQGLRLRNAGVLALALDLCVPPVALLGMAVFGLFVFFALFAWATGILAPLLLASVALLALTFALVTAWWRFARQIVPAKALMVAIFYMLMKIPIYLRFLTNRQLAWVRSKRDTEL